MPYTRLDTASPCDPQGRIALNIFYLQQFTATLATLQLPQPNRFVPLAATRFCGSKRRGASHSTTPRACALSRSGKFLARRLCRDPAHRFPASVPCRALTPWLPQATETCKET